jgi:hypothetical protein
LAGRPLSAREFVISADEKSSIQARRRKQPTLSPAPGRSTRVEHEYFREGAWTYLAAWDVHRAKVFGHCEKKTGIAPVDRLIGEVMSREPYKSARRVFWIMDNCSAHRGQRAVDRLRFQWPNVVLVHTPVHASWLNQIEIYFSIVQRKVLTPNDFQSLSELEQRLLAPIPGNRLALPMDLYSQRPDSSLGEDRKQTVSFRRLTPLQIRHRNSEQEH